MKHNFSVLERLILQNILPKEMNFVTLKIVRELQMHLGFSNKEIKDFKIISENGQVNWDDKKERTKSVEVGEIATNLVVKALVKLNEDKKLTKDHFTLCEKFTADRPDFL